MLVTLPARSGGHTSLRRGQSIRIINPSGHQVVDMWAFPATDIPSWMSMAQSRQKLSRVIPIVNDTFVDTRRQPVLTLVEDTSPGVHDMLYPPCDEWRYTEAGVPDHDSCAGNLKKELAAIVTKLGRDGVKEKSLIELEENFRTWGWAPEPLNLFMNVQVRSQGENERASLDVKSPLCKAGDYVVLRADVDCVVVMSACPNDVLDTNGGDPNEAVYEVLG